MSLDIYINDEELINEDCICAYCDNLHTRSYYTLIERLKSDPEKYKKYDPKNGWGSYERLIEVLEKYLEICEKYPTARIEVCR